MSEVTKFECDVTGEVFGALNAGCGVMDFEIRRQIRNSPFEISERKVHISHDLLDEEIEGLLPHRLKYIGIKDGEVVGASIGYRPDPRDDIVYNYEERGNVMIEKYEEFFEFVEETIVYG